MTTQNRNGLLMLIGGIFALVAAFGSSVGLPDSAQTVSIFLAIGSWLLIFWLQRRAKARGLEPGVTTPAQNKNQRVVILVISVVVTLSGPFWVPYTGVHLPFFQLVISALVSCALCIVVFLIAARRRRPKA